MIYIGLLVCFVAAVAVLCALLLIGHLRHELQIVNDANRILEKAIHAAMVRIVQQSELLSRRAEVQRDPAVDHEATNMAWEGCPHGD